MISVIATVRLKPGTREAFLEIFRANVPKVREETGCIEYFPALDIDSGLSAQLHDENVVTVIEKWESVAALQAHVTAPHMVAYKERTQDMVEDLSLKVLQAA